MTLQYNILCFEDDEDVIRALVPKIKAHVDDLGFEFHYESYEDGVSLLERINQRDYDLILTDLNLHDGALGDDIVEQIRQEAILTDVLLYSTNAAAIQEAQRRNPMIERISWGVGSGNDLLERIKRLISFTVRKVQDLNNMRGLVIASAISLETQIKEILLDYVAAIPETDTQKEKVMGRIYKNRVDSARKTLNTLEQRFNAQMLVALIEDDALFTANNVIESLESVLNEKNKVLNTSINQATDHNVKKTLQESQENVLHLRDDLKLFKQEVIEIRNTLAHVKEEVLDGRTVLQSRRRGSNPIIVSEDTYIKMRIDLAKHKRSLAIIAAHLS